ncbi:MAG: diaminopimelate epimerase [Lachnospiraceae bacterium]
MVFTKMEGCGNDYVYVDCTKNEMKNPSEIAKKVSDRHFGIGSDGLILIKSSEKADFFMEMYNADGSRSAMCGNGIRCVGKFVYDKGLTNKTQVAVDTLAGIKYLDLNVVDGKVASVKVNMGNPILEADKIPVKASKTPVINEKITVAGKEYEMTCVSMGNPHAIVYMDSIDDLEIEKIGPLFEHHEVFPERTNTEFIEVVDRKTLKMRVWERGAGETWACGTGACATLVASVLNGLCENEATIKLLGGDLKITWDRERDLIFMEGPATTVFEGTIEIE